MTVVDLSSWYVPIGSVVPSVSFESGTDGEVCSTAGNGFLSIPYTDSVETSSSNKRTTESLPRVLLFNDSDDEFHGREDSLDMYASSFQEDDSSSYSENSEYSSESVEPEHLGKMSDQPNDHRPQPPQQQQLEVRNGFQHSGFSSYGEQNFATLSPAESFQTRSYAGNENGYSDTNFINAVSVSFQTQNYGSESTLRYSSSYEGLSNCHSYSEDTFATCSSAYSSQNSASYLESSYENSQTQPLQNQENQVQFEEQKYTELSSATCMSKLEPFTEILQAKYRSFQNHDSAQCYEELVVRNGDSENLESKLGTTSLSPEIDQGEVSAIKPVQVEEGSLAHSDIPFTDSSQSASIITSSSDSLVEPSENLGEILKKTIVETVSA